MILRELLSALRATSKQSGIAPADFHFILADLLECKPVELSLLGDQELPQDLLTRYLEYQQRLLDHEPPQYIIGKAWFYGLELVVNPAVLIPRPETEGLVELALHSLQPGDRVLDIGTGSGAIAIALCKNLPGLQITATDCSSAALKVARHNAGLHQCQIEFQLADLFPESPETFDLIISNPPYISAADYTSLPVRVRDHEPETALWAGEQGLDYYERILARAGNYLSAKGMLLFEHGAGQLPSLLELAQKHHYRDSSAKNDLCARDRYLMLRFRHPGAS